jgi:hypothetical protein
MQSSIVWKEAAQELPKCPEESDVAAFLKDWANRTYMDEFKAKPVKKHFGLARASTLLHFISGGHFPIFDSRVRRAVARLRDEHVPSNDVGGYLHFCPLFKELATLCKTEADPRMLDKALFSYGSSQKL